MKIQGHRLHGYPKDEGLKKQKLQFGLYFDEGDNKVLISKYDFNKIPFEKFPGFENKPEHILFVNAVTNRLSLSLEESKQFIYFEFIHLETDTYCENPKTIITDDELQAKLFIDRRKIKALKKITFENFSEAIAEASESNCVFLDFLKVKVYSILG